jgi:guanylate kinase
MKNMIVIAGPSAVGKTTVSAEIIRQNDKVALSRSATTRAPRGDAHDSEYVYMTREEFASAIASGDMLEHTEYSGDLYGTPKSEILRAESEGKYALFILDLAGVASLRESEFADDTLFVYIYDNLNTLEERLYSRYMNPPTVDGLTRFAKRKEQNIADYLGFDKHAPLFDLMISNDTTVSETAANIIAAMSKTPAFDKAALVAEFYAMADEKTPRKR